MQTLNRLLLFLFFTVVTSQSPGGFYWVVTYNYPGYCFAGAPVTITTNTAGCAQDANGLLSGSTPVSYDFSDCSTNGTAWFWTTAVACTGATCDVQNCPQSELALVANPNDTQVCISNSSSGSTAVLCTPTTQLPAFPRGYLLSSVFSSPGCQGTALSTQVTSSILGQCTNLPGGQESSLVTCHGGGVSQTNYYGPNCQTVSQKSVSNNPACQATGSGGLLTGCTTGGKSSDAFLPLPSFWSVLVIGSVVMRLWLTS